MPNHGFCPGCDADVEPANGLCPACGGPLTRGGDQSLVGEVIDGRYELLSVLGKGGMGVVYRARQKYLEREVALKLLRRDVSEEGQLVKRFLLEARAASTLTSPNTVTVHDFGVTPDGRMYFTMELLPGESLADRLDREGSVPWPEAAEILMQTCTSLVEAHGRGIYHRDIKPDNLFLTRTGEGGMRVKVLDFGIAKLATAKQSMTQTGMLFGTPHYLSPEQARGEAIDGRSDLYSLGVVGYAMLAGIPPLNGDTAVQTVMLHLTERPVPLLLRAEDPHLPEELARVVMWALEKDPNARPRDAFQLAEAVRTAVTRREFIGPHWVEASGNPVDYPARPALVAAGPSPSPAPMPPLAEEELERLRAMAEEETAPEKSMGEGPMAADAEATVDAPAVASDREEVTWTGQGRHALWPALVAALAAVVLLAWYFWPASHAGKGLPDAAVAPSPSSADRADSSPGDGGAAKAPAGESDTVHEVSDDPAAPSEPDARGLADVQAADSGTDAAVRRDGGVIPDVREMPDVAGTGAEVRSSGGHVDVVAPPEDVGPVPESLDDPRTQPDRRSKGKTGRRSSSHRESRAGRERSSKPSTPPPAGGPESATGRSSDEYEALPVKEKPEAPKAPPTKSDDEYSDLPEAP